MLRRPQHNSVAQVLFRAALLTLLPPVAWATDGSELAPAAPDKPWIIPPPSDGAARAGVLNYRGRMRSLEQGNAVPIEPDRRYSLAELIDLAQRSNPETREAWEQARQAALAVGLVESSYAPQISVEAVSGFQRTPLPIPTTLIHKGYFTSDTRELIPMLSLKWLLFDFGRRAGLDEAARANSFVANVAFTGAHQKLIFAVSRAYFALGAARGRLKAAQQALETAETVQDAAQSRREHGLGTVVVLAQGQRQVAQARFTLTKASGDERTAYANLIATLGVAADAQINIADSSEQPLPAEPPDNVETLLRDALTNRPDVVAALGKIDAAEAELKSQRGAYYPTIALAGQVYQNLGALSTEGSPYSSVNRPGAGIFLTLSVPVFDGGARASRTSVARSQVAAARDKFDQARDAAAQQVVNAYNDLKSSLAAHSAAVALRMAAQTAYDAALEAYVQGVGTYTDVANEQTALERANAEQEDAHASVFTAAAALAFATGAVQSR